MQSFQNHFLIAMPSLDDPYFSRSLTYICEHNEHGAMGIVINQPSGLTLKELMSQVDNDSIVLENKADDVVLSGGPVSQDRGFILHTPQPGWSSSLELTSEITITTSSDILGALGNEKAPHKSLIALGYAGWQAEQLEDEIQRNSWLIIEADAELLFDVPFHKKWETAVRKLGIDPWQLAPEAGHA